MDRLTKTYEDGTHGVAENLPFGENSYKFKNALIQKLGEYEDLNYSPNEIKAKMCFLDTYSRADSDGRLVLILDKHGYCEELGLHIDEIRRLCKTRKQEDGNGKNN